MNAKMFNSRYPAGTRFWHRPQEQPEKEKRAVKTIRPAMDLKSATVVELNVEPWLANVNSLTRAD